MLREVLPVLRTVDRRRRPRCHENNENHLWGENHSSPTHQRHWQHQQAFEEIRTGDEQGASYTTGRGIGE
jgi:hypothetical protein